MDIDLSKLNGHSESETLELKESFDKQALETIGAFANTRGGTILIGVRDDGHVVGLTIGNTTLEEWAQKMQSKIQPRYLPSIVPHQHNGRTVVAISVERSDSLLSIDGRYSKRVGRTNQLMGPEETRQRLLSSGNGSWDSQIIPNASLADLNNGSIDEFVRLLQLTDRRPVGSEANPQEILNKVGLLHENQPTRAAILLLGKNPNKFFFTSFLQLGRFRSSTQIVDDKRLEGNIIEQIGESMIWFKQRFETELIISGKAARDERWEYPLTAVREGIINALCHREYNSASNTQVRLYDNRLEIWNPGGLPYQLTPEALLQDHQSFPRNPIIARSLFYAGFIESWGSGTIKIVKEAQLAGLDVPEFITSPSAFRLIISKPTLTEALLTKQGLSQRQIAAVLYTQEQGQITNHEYQNQTAVSRATAARELAELVAKGVFVRHGTTGKNTFYTITPRNASNAS